MKSMYQTKNVSPIGPQEDIYNKLNSQRHGDKTNTIIFKNYGSFNGKIKIFFGRFKAVGNLI